MDAYTRAVRPFTSFALSRVRPPYARASCLYVLSDGFCWYMRMFSSLMSSRRL